MTHHGHRYPPQAVLLYIALGIALGMVGWALWLQDDGSSNPRTPAQAPAQTTQQDNGR